MATIQQKITRFEKAVREHQGNMMMFGVDSRLAMDAMAKYELAKKVLIKAVMTITREDKK